MRTDAGQSGYSGPEVGLGEVGGRQSDELGESRSTTLECTAPRSQGGHQVNLDAHAEYYKTFFHHFGPKPKGRPRGKPFQKGEPLPYQFKPGQSGNPGGKPKVHQTQRKEYESFLGRPAPVGLCREVGLPEKSTFAAIIAAVMCYRAVFSPAAAKEIRRATEGDPRVLERADGHINYSAGLKSKELLIRS